VSVNGDGHDPPLAVGHLGIDDVCEPDATGQPLGFCLGDESPHAALGNYLQHHRRDH
jgi:hypothetical protein